MLPPRKVDIILPNYNYGHFLEEGLQHIANQTFADADFNLLILDNGSTIATTLFENGRKKMIELRLLLTNKI